MVFGLVALKVDLKLLVGGLGSCCGTGKLNFALAYAIVFGLLNSFPGTTTVLATWMDSSIPLCLPAISISLEYKKGYREGELLTHLTDGSVKRNISEFLVHIMGSGSRHISENDSVVSHSGGFFLVDLLKFEFEWAYLVD
jgi:hypothetical protein